MSWFRKFFGLDEKANVHSAVGKTTPAKRPTSSNQNSNLPTKPKPSPSTGQLRLEKNDTVGVLKDESGTVRGLWFPDKESASDPRQVHAIVRALTAKGENIDEKDALVIFAAARGHLGEMQFEPEPAGDVGGYFIKF